MKELFLAFLAQHDDAAWLRAVDRLEGAIHPVDRAATRIWLHFFPLALERVMARPEAATLARKMTLAGQWRLADQIERSHAFLYGHQYWLHARRTVLDYADAAAPGSLDLAAQIHEAAERTARAAGVSAPLTTGITAVALRTLQQVGPDALAASPETLTPDGAYAGLSADRVVARREASGTRGWRTWLGSHRGTQVMFDERQPAARFPIVPSQHLTTAAALDRRPFRERDARCSEGPIPVHCRSCACGTCWVGILGGADRLAPMDARERDKLQECGVAMDDAPAPIRLACMTEVHDSVSIVIPPWNGLLGRVLSARD